MTQINQTMTPDPTDAVQDTTLIVRVRLEADVLVRGEFADEDETYAALQRHTGMLLRVLPRELSLSGYVPHHLGWLPDGNRPLLLDEVEFDGVDILGVRRSERP